MSKRSYQQYCPLAVGLDLVGERWTLLIVRELGLGPRRFGDLGRGLPGLSPNLLTTRLNAMQEAGIVARVHLPPPANVDAYELTESGRDLAAAMGPFLRWGLRHLPATIPADMFVSPIAALLALRLMYRPVPSPAPPVEAEITLAPDVFQVSPSAAGLHIAQGNHRAAALALQTTPAALIAQAASPAAPQNDTLLLRGTPRLLQAFFSQFALQLAAQQTDRSE